MNWLDACEKVLRDNGTPTVYRDVADHIMRQNFVDTKTRTPAITLHTSVGQDVRRRRARGLPPRFTLSKGVIGLAEWEIGPFEDAMETIQKTREKAKRDLLAKLRRLDGPDFEAFLEVLFTEMGYDVQATGGSGDDGIDLVGELSSGVGAQRIGIQAKCMGANRRIGPNVIRLLRDALSTRGCNAGAVVATCEFNDDARAVAAEPGKPPLELIGPDRLTDLALEFKVGIQTEPLEAYRESLESVFKLDEATGD
jgi:restriction endonuclease Mrr